MQGQTGIVSIKGTENTYSDYKQAIYGYYQHIRDTGRTELLINSTKIIRVNKKGLFLNILGSLQ
jgi:hypothetical protein